MKQVFCRARACTTLQISSTTTAFFYGDHAICGTRGWFYEAGSPRARTTGKMLAARGRCGLKTSLKAGGGRKPIYCFLHYPPHLSGLQVSRRCCELLRQIRGRSSCYYGHLHGYTHRRAFEGMRERTEYALDRGGLCRLSACKNLQLRHKLMQKRVEILSEAMVIIPLCKSIII